MELFFTPIGNVFCLYGEEIELSKLGSLRMRRASRVEPTAEGQWTADLAPLAGPVLGPFRCRSAALAAEARWINEHFFTELD